MDEHDSQISKDGPGRSGRWSSDQRRPFSDINNNSWYSNAHAYFVANNLNGKIFLSYSFGNQKFDPTSATDFIYLHDSQEWTWSTNNYKTLDYYIIEDSIPDSFLIKTKQQHSNCKYYNPGDSGCQLHFKIRYEDSNNLFTYNK